MESWTDHISLDLIFENPSKSPAKKNMGSFPSCKKRTKKKFSLVLWCFNYTPKRTASHASPQKKNGGFFPDDFSFSITLPETNIAPENEPLEKEIPIGNHHF